MFEIFKEFRFDAAHTLGGNPDSDPSYGRIHGHSYLARVWVKGELGADGWVIDLGAFESRLKQIRNKLDHHFLDHVEGLGKPTMESLCAFIWRDLSNVKGLFKIEILRKSCGDGCIYYGPVEVKPAARPERARANREIAHAE